MELISKEQAKLIRTLGAPDDGDVYPLGPGKNAEFDASKKGFTIRVNGKVVGTVPLRAVISGSKDDGSRENS